MIGNVQFDCKNCHAGLQNPSIGMLRRSVDGSIELMFDVAVAQFELVRAATSDENISEMMDARALTLKIFVLFLRIFLYVMTFQ